PGPFGDRLLLRILRETQGAALAVDEEAIRDATSRLARVSGVDAAPEGGAALAVAERMAREGSLGPSAEVVIFNTGSGASYRW
ncbi:MAG TPA: pyridoxal-phosphate dependent enzyme, partial [Vulgatibacter sp.]